MILGDTSLTLAAVPTQLSIEAAGSTKHVIQKPIEEGQNNIRPVYATEKLSG